MALVPTMHQSVSAKTLLMVLSVATSPQALRDAGYAIVEAQGADATTLAGRHAEQVVALSPEPDSRQPEVRPLSKLFLLVERPYDDLKPVWKKAMSSVGRSKVIESTRPWLDARLIWFDLLVAAHPEVARELAEKTDGARLRAALKAGAITEPELQLRLQLAASEGERSPDRLAELETLKGRTSRGTEAVISDSFGWWNKETTELTLTVVDAQWLLGRPATLFALDRHDVEKDPNYERNSLTPNYVGMGGTRSPFRLHDWVPAPAAVAVVEALAPFGVKLGSSPLEFVPAPAHVGPVAMLVQPPAQLPKVAGERVALQAVEGLPADSRTLHRVVALPGGDLAVTVEYVDPKLGFQWGVYRVHRDRHALRAKALWTGAYGGKRLALSADGAMLWFAELSEEKVRAHRVTLAKDRLESATVTMPAGLTAHENSQPAQDWFNSFVLDADQRPVGLMKGSDESWVLVGLNEKLAPIARGRSGRSAVAHTMRLARQVPSGKRGDPAADWGSGWWLTDDLVAHLDTTGRTTKAVALPPAPRRDTPLLEPLLFPAAGTMLIGFNSQAEEAAPDDPSRPRRMRNIDGVHLVNLAAGEVQRSAHSTVTSLGCAARSAGGRWFALGGGSYPQGQPGGVFDARTAMLALLLEYPTPVSDGVRSLAFAWDGHSVWGSDSEALWRWELPAHHVDAAAPGTFPDQVYRP